ncbi:unnamed protein product [Rangifer tarandus platyrhynchus]|uniref:Thyroglobulin type-1 domain-containing protein n=2 Tax=Rangifer tarandus platyrhynchus TaxID=3082113 RepID=A0ABN8YG16_RANTA|nr:unnamed protein product [Rangifer tarandus platyrhynchus]CAI9699158.1 unnamed protein product [Rangifer tarandus platyrhynchus]
MMWPKYWSFSFSISPSNEHPGLISFKMDWLDLLAVQGTLKSLLQHLSSKAPIFRCSAFFTVQLSHAYMTTGKTIALTRWTFVGKVMSLLFNMLSRLVITFLPSSKHLLISWLQSPSTPPPGDPRPLQALLDGRGLCANASAVGRLRPYLLPAPPAPGNGSESEEDHSMGSTESQALPSTHRVPDSKFHPVHNKMDVIKKGHAKDSQRYKVDYESQSTDTQNFSSESKRETEYGPCRREMEDTLNHLKFLNMLSPRGIHIPNCDKKGFYKKKQCRPSKGRKRGFCWCVDKYGQPLPGFDVKGKGDVQCYSMDSK